MTPKNRQVFMKIALRLSKLMSERGLCSRREADNFIARGLVWVNGVCITQLGTKVLPDVEIRLDSHARRQQKSKVTIILNKPIGFVSNLPEKGYRPAIELVTAANQDPRWALADGPSFHHSHLQGLAVAGRLDIDSQGLLIFTQDGRMAKHLIGADSPVEKEYLVRVDGGINKSRISSLCSGLSLDDRALKPAKVEQINESQLRMVLKEGRKRQIRRMCELVGLKVTGLKRVRVGNLRLESLTEGQWRYLRPDEKI
jgi:23S rRNA pseudouridine2604 synthase